ncbi:unnamed protein product, partial [Didymodactylos carnosus]
MHVDFDAQEVEKDPCYVEQARKREAVMQGYMRAREITEQILTTDYGQITAYYKTLAEASRFRRVNDVLKQTAQR